MLDRDLLFLKYQSPLGGNCLLPFSMTMKRSLIALAATGLLLTACLGFGSPSVDLKVETDDNQGWNLYLDTKNFTFTPEKLTDKADDNEGYAILIVNGQYITRLYSEWTHIPGLPEGVNRINVTLFHNDHTPIQIDGTDVADEEKVEVTAQ